MVWLNDTVDLDSGDDMAKRVDNPQQRRKSYFDGEHWNAETRDRLGVRMFSRVEIPNTNKADMKKYAELLYGLATEMEYVAANTSLTEHGASLRFRFMVSHINRELKIIGKVSKKGREG